jgi:hypothetical protein
VTVEFYTLPLYITAMGSVKEEDSCAVQIIHSVVVEEMLHLQLAANLCRALDTMPNFTPPQYGADLPYISSYDRETGDRGVLNAALGPLDDERLNTMLDIEMPEQIQLRQTISHTTPNYPYNSIGEMYDALIVGINKVGTGEFSWTTELQQQHWEDQNFSQIISSYSCAQDAAQAIVNQGGGQHLQRGHGPTALDEKKLSDSAVLPVTE